MAKDNKVVMVDGFPYCECSLLDKVIDAGLCYDIQMIRGKSIRPEALQQDVDYEKANEICPDCPFNQLTGN